MSNAISTTERRFREGKGQRYLADGVTIRCHAVAKGKLAAIRERDGNPGLVADDVWPEGQCEHAAVPGKLLCGGRGGHGGGSRNVPMIDMLSYLPVDLAEKMNQLIENPALLSSKFEIVQLFAHNLEIFERLKDREFVGRAGVDAIQSALKQIEGGEIVSGVDKIRKVMGDLQAEQDTYDEFRNNVQLLKDLRRTEIMAIKETREMATTEQLLALLVGLADDMLMIVERHINDERIRTRVVSDFAACIRRRTNIGVTGYAVTAGDIVDGDAVPVE